MSYQTIDSFIQLGFGYLSDFPSFDGKALIAWKLIIVILAMVLTAAAIIAFSICFIIISYSAYVLIWMIIYGYRGRIRKRNKQATAFSLTEHGEYDTA